MISMKIPIKSKISEALGKEENNNWFICPKCKNSIPLLSHFFSEEKQKWLIEIRCSCQKNAFSMDIEEFLKVKINPKNIKEILFINYIENGLENKGKTHFCKNCLKILDNNSFDKHKGHSIINLIEEAKKVDDSFHLLDSGFDEVKNNIEINYQISLGHQIDIIENQIKELGEMKKKLENAYNQNKKINQLFIEYIQIIINNYKNARKLDNNLVNYNVLKNLINNTEFNKSKFEVSEEQKNILETSEKLCNFYKYNCAIKRKFNNLEMNQQINHTQNINILCKISKDIFAVGEGGRNTDTEKNYFNIIIYKRDKSKNEYKIFKIIEKAHSGEITALCKVVINNNDYLLSGDLSDKLINIYDIKNNYKKVMYLSGHKRKIVTIISLNKIFQYKNWIASCSTGLNIKLWDLSEIGKYLKDSNDKNAEPIKGPEITYSIKGHIKSIKCLFQMSDGTLISNASDKKLKFWDIDKKICIKTMDDILVSSTFSICELDNNRIVLGCFDVIKIINVNTLIIENELKAHEVYINCLCITPDGLLFSGDSEGILVLWELSAEGKKIYSEKKESAIKTIDLLNEDTIIVGLLNSCVDIFKYK